MGDTVRLQRYVDTRNDVAYYVVTDTGGISAQSPCVQVSSTRAACRITSGLTYQLDTGAGDDTVTIAADAPGAGTDLGPRARPLHRRQRRGRRRRRQRPARVRRRRDE